MFFAILPFARQIVFGSWNETAMQPRVLRRAECEQRETFVQLHCVLSSAAVGFCNAKIRCSFNDQKVEIVEARGDVPIVTHFFLSFRLCACVAIYERFSCCERSNFSYIDVCHVHVVATMVTAHSTLHNPAHGVDGVLIIGSRETHAHSRSSSL